MKRFDGDDSRSDGYHFHRGSGGQGMFPFLIAETLVMFMLVAFPQLVTVPARWFY